MLPAPLPRPFAGAASASDPGRTCEGRVLFSERIAQRAAPEEVMISFGVRRTMEVALMLACVTPGAAFPQLDSARYADEVLNRLVDTIEDVRDRSGVHSAELIEPMRALALYYLEHEDYPLAIAAIQQARQAIRVNYGLFSLEEA